MSKDTTVYNRSALSGDEVFTDWSTASPTVPHEGDKLDAEFNAIEDAIDATQSNLALIQRDDGQLANDSVGVDQLKSELQAGLNEPAQWATATEYSLRDAVVFDTGLYKCVDPHTSGTFSTDLAAGRWELLFDFADIGVPTASATSGLLISSGAISVDITRATAETTVVSDDMVFIWDASANALRKMTYANFVTPVAVDEGNTVLLAEVLAI